MGQAPVDLILGPIGAGASMCARDFCRDFSRPEGAETLDKTGHSAEGFYAAEPNTGFAGNEHPRATQATSPTVGVIESGPDRGPEGAEARFAVAAGQRPPKRSSIRRPLSSGLAAMDSPDRFLLDF